ncbi:uncharacterized protein LOC120086170 [Benincasa hispida]|uniref:uncharacterized protein LOC120086170 n=1 Tax=Benincasa hispida TaxID=102211 RepID=UPI0019027E70|nr:uncharacterized protein LOC120086170 [Benincasa hispida]XP_038898607.1 uncharacterized protein LOC120086170 [Benincasa hispida]
MLLRTSSTPILNSWLHQSKSSPSESDQIHQLQRAKSISLISSFHPPPPSSSNESPKRVIQSLLESDSADPRRKIPLPKCCKVRSKVKSRENGVSVRDQDLKPTSDSSSSSIHGVFFNSGLGLKFPNDQVCDEKRDACVLQTLVVGGGMGNDGGRVCGGGRGSDGGGGGDNGRSGFNNHHGSNSTDAYYQKMIEANPNNALLLGNYAKFLKEVHGDFSKAEEFCGRAILADPNDASVLSLYADLIWRTQRDAQRAEAYFDQAVKSSPDDCYLLASYARFLWDTDVDEEDDTVDQYETEESHMSQSGYSHGAPHHSPLAAAS